MMIMNFYRFTKILVLCVLYVKVLFPQDIKVNKIEPPNWWSGMKYNKVQFMLYGNNLNNLSLII
jgi:hypothetical protein